MSKVKKESQTLNMVANEMAIKSIKEEFVIQPTDYVKPIDTSVWPLLLKVYIYEILNYNLELRSIISSYWSLYTNTMWFFAIKQEYKRIPQVTLQITFIRYGIINLDKPSNPSSHEVVSWVKKILGVEKTGHCGTLDPKVTGCLIICIERATRLAKAQQAAGKEYVAVLKLHDRLDSTAEMQKVNHLPLK